MINVMEPNLGKEELARIEEVFNSKWIGKGKLVSEFEEKYAQYIGSDREHVVSTNCCTEGLFSSMYLLDIKPGDEVIVPTISFVGAGNAVCSSGAKLVLCDVDPHNLNVRAEDIKKVLTPKTKAVMLLHFGGIPCEMDDIMKLCSEYNIKVIEDCAAGVSSRYKGKALGTFGDIGMWSFDAMKILVAGDGAILHFNDINLKNRAEKYLYFGLEAKSGYENNVAQKWWEFEISCFGHRAIMNNVTAAMALEQLKKLPEFMRVRKNIHCKYNKEFNGISWFDTPIDLPEYMESSYYFYHIQLKNGKRDQLARFLRNNDIYTTYRYYPLHRVKGYGINNSEFSNADYATDNTLCLPIHQGLSDVELEYVIEKVKEFGNKYC